MKGFIEKNNNTYNKRYYTLNIPQFRNFYSTYCNKNKIYVKLLTYPKDRLFVLILGPTATVLAYELSKHGYTAYDVGHVAKDYDAFMRKADRSPVAIPIFFAPD